MIFVFVFNTVNAQTIKSLTYKDILKPDSKVELYRTQNSNILAFKIDGLNRIKTQYHDEFIYFNLLNQKFDTIAHNYRILSDTSYEVLYLTIGKRIEYSKTTIKLFYPEEVVIRASDIRSRKVLGNKFFKFRNSKVEIIKVIDGISNDKILIATTIGLFIYDLGLKSFEYVKEFLGQKITDIVKCNTYYWIVIESKVYAMNDNELKQY